MAKDVKRLVIGPRREHSRKPDEVYSRIERLAQGPYLEMFSRQSREVGMRWAIKLLCSILVQCERATGHRIWVGGLPTSYRLKDDKLVPDQPAVGLRPAPPGRRQAGALIEAFAKLPTLAAILEDGLV